MRSARDRRIDQARTWGTIVLLGLCAACAPASDPQPTTAPPTTTTTTAPPPAAQPSLADTLVASAQGEQFDQSQRDILADGDVSFEEYESAVDRALTCMREGGLTVDRRGTTEVDGQARIDYTVDTPSGDRTAAATLDSCYDRYARLVDTYWQAVVPERDGYYARRDAALTPALQECLTRNDVTWAPGESMDELLLRAAELQEDGGADCPAEIGLATWSG